MQTTARVGSPQASLERKIAFPRESSDRLLGPKTAPRNEYILQVKSGGASLFPGIERPATYLELENLLDKASKPLGEYAKHSSWIKTSGIKNAKYSAFAPGAQRSKSALILKQQETVVERTRRLHPLRSRGPQKKEKTQSHDDLELMKPSLALRAPLQPFQKMGSLKQTVMVTREEIVARANQLQQNQEDKEGPQGAPSEEEFQHKLRAWVSGERRGVAGQVMREAREKIWKSELERSSELGRCAVKIQGLWRSHWQRSRFRKYVGGRDKRERLTLKEMFSLWVRVHYQRSKGRGCRSLLSFWTIAWRVEVRNIQIAREKAKDLCELWHAVFSKRVLKGWLRASRAMRMQRGLRMGRGLLYWQHYCSDERIWKRARATVRRRFIHYAYLPLSLLRSWLIFTASVFLRFRVLLFHGRCSAKCRQRSYKLFRLEEQSVHALVMPVDRFRGYGTLFNCEELLERFRDKDWIERRVQRQCYVRLAPRVVENWCLAVDDRKMCRYAKQRCEKTLLQKSLQGLRELTALDENGERLHKAASDSEPEAEQEAAGEEDMVKQLETDIDHLSGLVDHEHRENLRLKVKEEKRKMMVRIKFDALSKEREVIEKMPAEYEKSSRRLEEDIVRRETQFMQKQREEAQLLESVQHQEHARWGAALDRIRRMWDKAVDVLAQVFDDAQEKRRQEVFLRCWLLIRRPAFKVRIRRVMNRGHMRRLLVICAHHRKMERSIHKFRPLRLLYSSLLKWFKLMEDSFTVTTPGLKARVRRRYELRQAMSEQLEVEHQQRPLGSRPMTQHEMLANPNLVLAAWMEWHCTIRAYRAVTQLMATRARARLLARAFEFLWLGKARHTGDMADEEEEGEPCFMAANASADLSVWRKCFFTGTRYTTVLRKAAEMRKRMALKLVKASVRLAPLLWDRKELVTQQLEHEQRLLIRHMDDSESRHLGKVGTSGIVLTGSYPEKHWSTVLNMRRSEVLLLLEACDAFAQRVHRSFGSVIVAYGLSLWLFRIRCHYLPKLKAKSLTSDKWYWRHIRELFQRARTGHLMLNQYS